jgi:hypothetical protein
MLAQLIVLSAAVILVACNRLPPTEAKLVGSWKAQTSPESVTIFTFEPNHADWCAVTVRDDTWLDGDGQWHIEGKQIVFDNVSYPKVSEEYSRKDPELAKRPKHYTATFEQVDHDTIKLDGVTLTRTDRPPKPSKQAPFSP